MQPKEINRGKHILYYHVKNDGSTVPPNEIVSTWTDGYREVVNLSNNNKGLRTPQFGALSAIRSFWTVSNDPATIVMPTGTGKTETMLATIVAEKCKKVLIVVPSDLLRQQIFEKSKELGVLYDVGVLDPKVLTPNVSLIAHKFHKWEQLKSNVDHANIIITTIRLASQLKEEYKQYLSAICDVLIVDEAHHIPTKTWSQFRSYFSNNKILQFTATPFRNDAKKVDGKVIYNFPLRVAQEQGYFQKIAFHPIEEFNDKKSDEHIAERAVFLLREDIKLKYNHILLVRAKDTKRANDLYENIYLPLYKDLNPVLITSEISSKRQKERIQSLINLESKIVVCVDMFGEGIDIPYLKIAAIHDKYKSLPITLQFVGRFARTQEGLGNAKLVTNIASEEIKESIKDLYDKDADWNELLPTYSEKLIGKELSIQNLEQGFLSNSDKSISIKQLIPSISMYAYKVMSDDWNWENWIEVFDKNICRYFINQDQRVLIIIEPRESKVRWTTQQDIHNLEWELYVIYWNEEKGIAFVNATDKSKSDKLINALFGTGERITGESVFKCLHGINRLMLSTVGLNSEIDGPVKYKMFAGIDISEGLSEAMKENSTKSNLFGVGYNGNGKVSIGCSYKGTIWAKWVESIDFWMEWCDKIIEKVLDDNINSQDILEGVLIPKTITKLPNSVPYRIDWPIELDLAIDKAIYLVWNDEKIPIYQTEIGLSRKQDLSNAINFYVTDGIFKANFRLELLEEGYVISSNSKNKVSIVKGKRTYTLEDFFNQNTPTIKFVDQSTLQGNLYVTLNNPVGGTFPRDRIKTIDWSKVGVDISKESQKKSQTGGKREDSIQYFVIQQLLNSEKHTIVFDDDGKGEIADIVAIKEESQTICFDFYHCKYSQGKHPGGRINDLYEVCGQSEKSVHWKQNPIAIIERMKKRESIKRSDKYVSRFEKGNMDKLQEIQNKLKMYPADLNITIVQPGVDRNSITEDMDRVLVSAQSYLTDTYSVPLRLFCS